MVESYEEARDRMVQDQLVSRGIKDPRVLASMSKVPRHLFVSEELRDRAYGDHPLAIGNDQTISQPYMVALMVEALGLKGEERVLEVGTGSGYEAAILAELCGQLFTVELVEELALRARARLDNLGYRNVSIQVGDGTLGWEQHAPFDAVVISAGAPCIPRPLLEQLRPGGCLLLPMGEEALQSLVRIRKGSEGLTEDYLGECRFVKLMGTYGWES
jgi:protein-L-isoaspartate(D-aspartate) O-methyltransferase